MEFERKFVIDRPHRLVRRDLEDDLTLAAFFPGTRVTRKDKQVRETVTPYRALGQSREIRFVFKTLPDGTLHFAKICDGQVWRSLEGEIRLEEQSEQSTLVKLRMQGRTRSFVPEIGIRGPMREQIEQMATALRSRLASA